MAQAVKRARLSAASGGGDEGGAISPSPSPSPSPPAGASSSADLAALATRATLSSAPSSGSSSSSAARTPIPTRQLPSHARSSSSAQAAAAPPGGYLVRVLQRLGVDEVEEEAEGHLTLANARALTACGLRTAEDVLSVSLVRFRQLHADISPAVVRAFRTLVQQLHRPQVRTAGALLDHCTPPSMEFVFGCGGALQELVGSAVSTGEVCELVGPSASGKTQLALQLATFTAARSCVSIAYIDTTMSFSGQRVLALYESLGSAAEMAKEQHVLRSPEETMRAIRHLTAFTLPEVISVLHALKHELETFPEEVSTELRLVVIDSISAVITPVLGGGRQTGGHALMSELMHLIKTIARRFHVAFVTTNTTVSGGGPRMVPRPGALLPAESEIAARVAQSRRRPALGLTWSYAADTRIVLHPVELAVPVAGFHHVAVLQRSSRKQSDGFVWLKVAQAGIESATHTSLQQFQDLYPEA